MLSSDTSLASGPARPARDEGLPAGQLGAGLLCMAGGWCLLRSPAANTSLFLQFDRLGAAAPAVWSCLSVAGHAVAALILLNFNARLRPDRVARFLWILLAGGLAIQAVKHGLDAARPLAVLGPGAMTVVGEQLRTHSMPSGHSATAFAMLGLVAQESRGRGGLGRLAALAPWGALALGIAISRMAVGAHWPSDVLMGAGLGLVFSSWYPRAWVDALGRFFGGTPGRRAMGVVLLGCAADFAATPSVLAALGIAGGRFTHSLATGYPLAEPLQWLLAVLALAGAALWWTAAGRAARA